MSIRFATVYRDTYGETQRRMDRDTPLWQFFSMRKKIQRKRRKTARKISRYPSENSRNRECCTASWVTIFTDIPVFQVYTSIFILKREDFYRAWLVHIYACMVFFTFFQISSLDCPIYPIISLLIDSFNQWHFVFLFQIFYINTCTYNISLKKQLQSL